MEDVAENYLKELIHRSMIQVTGEESCRLHDLMRDLAQLIAEDENFCKVFDAKEAIHKCKARRLSIQNNMEDIPRSTSVSRLRSFFVFGKDMIPSSSLNRIFPASRQLRVLDLGDASIHRVPDKLANLFNLRYLSLKNTNVKKLPKSLGKLRNLQTIDIRHSKVKQLPGWIKNMKNLRHLYTYRHTCKNDVTYSNGTQAPLEICELKCLQSLKTVEANAKIVQQFGNLTQLRELAITKVRKEYGKELCSSIQKMECLLRLEIRATNEETLQVDGLSSPPHRLQKLFLRGHLEKLPHWIGSLRNLISLCLQWSRLQEDLLSPIGLLPSLESLILWKAYDGQQLWFLDGCFRRLKYLYLRKLKHLNHVTIERGAMPSIQEIYLYDWGKLKTLPRGIEHLSGLQRLRLREMPEELIERLRADKSQERKRVQHIPIIINVIWREGKRFYENPKALNCSINACC
ncbi:hypothetical protein AAC387_Pa07g1538 [Persea americana]